MGLADGEGQSVPQPRPSWLGCSRALGEPLLSPAPWSLRSAPRERLVMFSTVGKLGTVTAQLPVLRLEAHAAIANAHLPAPGHGRPGSSSSGARALFTRDSVPRLRPSCGRTGSAGQSAESSGLGLGMISVWMLSACFTNSHFFLLHFLPKKVKV